MQPSVLRFSIQKVVNECTCTKFAPNNHSKYQYLAQSKQIASAYVALTSTNSPIIVHDTSTLQSSSILLSCVAILNDKKPIPLCTASTYFISSVFYFTQTLTFHWCFLSARPLDLHYFCYVKYNNLATKIYIRRIATNKCNFTC